MQVAEQTILHPGIILHNNFLIPEGAGGQTSGLLPHKRGQLREKK